MKIIFSGAIIAIATTIAAPALSGAQSSVCRGLSGSHRTACLNAEVERGRRELARIEQRNRNLDRAKTVVCVGTRSSAPGAIGGAIGDRALRQDRPCTRRVR